MVANATQTETSNTIGAIVFIFYVLDAIVLTALLSRDLVKEWLYLPKRMRNDEKLQNRLQAFTALAFLSFSVLSYHMLDYLVESYEAWAQDRNIALPSQFYGKGGLFGPSQQRAPLHIWTWLRTSTLFHDFARSICEPSQHFWWSQQALLATMSWNLYLSIEGTLPMHIMK